VNEPTPEQAAAALHTVRHGKEQVIESAGWSRRAWIISGLVVFLYCVVIDLVPSVRSWLHWPLVLGCLAFALVLRTRRGSAMLGRPVSVSNRSLQVGLRWRLLRLVPLLAIGIGGSLLVNWLELPHGTIYYGALAGLYLMVLGPKLQLWMLRRQDEVNGGRT
jgi:hypothetical protein